MKRMRFSCRPDFPLRASCAAGAAYRVVAADRAIESLSGRVRRVRSVSLWSGITAGAARGLAPTR